MCNTGVHVWLLAGQAVEAPHLILDGQYLHVAEAGLEGVGAKGGGA